MHGHIQRRLAARLPPEKRIRGGRGKTHSAAGTGICGRQRYGCFPVSPDGSAQQSSPGQGGLLRMRRRIRNPAQCRRRGDDLRFVLLGAI